ncbi:MAG: hypothetical protein FJ264_12395 [Planctomycetes bacterium]|nr:hypothetical protein [Planctomycetota bacterium]
MGKAVMSARGAFFVSSVILIFCMVFNGFTGAAHAKEEEKEKSELAELMCGIDMHYKVLERLATYFSFEEIENEREIYANASSRLLTHCKTATTKFARPDDDKYQILNNAMLRASESINVMFAGTEKTYTLEDVLWQMGILRQSCSDCHKHLDIQFGR